MNLIEKFDAEMIKAREGCDSSFISFPSEIYLQPMSDFERSELFEHVSKAYVEVDFFWKITLLSILNKIDEVATAKLARLHIEEAYTNFRYHGSYLHQLIFSIVRGENLSISTSSIEYEKNMRIAYALFNNLNITNGDYSQASIISVLERFEGGKIDADHEDFVKRFNGIKPLVDPSAK